MADVLSQNEIDALLSALSTGSIEAEEIALKEERHKVKKYDFRSPQKFSKDHIRALEFIHDNFSRGVSNYLTAQLRKNTKIRINTIEQITYDEFTHSVQNPTIISLFKLEPLVGAIQLELNKEVSFLIIDILLGGSGNKVRVNKEFSEIDKNIMLQINKDICKYLEKAWKEVLDVKVELDSMETSTIMNQALGPNEPIALINFSVLIGSVTTYMNLCIPYILIEKILDKLVVQHWLENKNIEDKTEEFREKIKDCLDTVIVTVNAGLGTTELTVNEFLKLGVGDIIKLDKKSIEPVEIFVEEELCFYGEPGIVSRNKGVSILDSVK